MGELERGFDWVLFRAPRARAAWLLYLGFALLPALACAGAASNQAPPRAASSAVQPGALLGVVEDGAGAQMSGVTVLAVSSEHGATSAGFTDQIGFYQIGNLVPGTYDVTFSHRDRRLTKRQVMIEAGRCVPLNVVFAAPEPADGEEPPGR